MNPEIDTIRLGGKISQTAVNQNADLTHVSVLLAADSRVKAQRSHENEIDMQVLMQLDVNAFSIST
jgi:hypothetical protein